MCGAGCHGAADDLRDLSDRLEAPLIHAVKGKDFMRYDDPRRMGGIRMTGASAVYDAIARCDVLLMVGSDYPCSNFLPTKPGDNRSPPKKPTTGSSPRREPPWPNSRRRPACVGTSGSASSAPTTTWASITARPAHGAAGADT